MPAHVVAASTLVPTAGDVGATFRVEVTASNALGRATARSSASAPVPGPPSNTAPPVLKYADSGTFTASAGEWEGYPRPRYRYQWQHCDSQGRDCVDIRGALRGPVYRPRKGQPKCDIRVIVTASNEEGTSTAESTLVKSCVD